MPTRRLDDRIRLLSAKLAAAQNSDARASELATTMQDLLAAIHEKVERLRKLAANKLLNPPGNEDRGQKERRVIRR